jgi:hypothetical protein
MTHNLSNLGAVTGEFNKRNANAAVISTHVSRVAKASKPAVKKAVKAVKGTPTVAEPAPTTPSLDEQNATTAANKAKGMARVQGMRVPNTDIKSDMAHIANQRQMAHAAPHATAPERPGIDLSGFDSQPLAPSRATGKDRVPAHIQAVNGLGGPKPAEYQAREKTGLEGLSRRQGRKVALKQPAAGRAQAATLNATQMARAKAPTANNPGVVQSNSSLTIAKRPSVAATIEASLGRYPI